MGNLIRAFVDTNVAVDYATDRDPFAADAQALFETAARREVVLGAAAMTFPFAYYVAEQTFRNHGAAALAIRALRKYCLVVPMDEALIDAAQDNPIDDLEDAVQYECALHMGAEAIVTRDGAGFLAGRIPTYSVIDFLKAHHLRT